MAKVSLAFRIESDRKKALQSRADDMGISLADFLRDGVELLEEFDLHFWKRIVRISESVNLKPSKVIQNIIIEQFAFLDSARKDSSNSPYNLGMFAFNEEGLITGEQLYSLRKLIHTRNRFSEQINTLKTQVTTMMLQVMELEELQREASTLGNTDISRTLTTEIKMAQAHLKEAQDNLRKSESQLVMIEAEFLSIREEGK